jgi:hypothetical protein
MSWNISTNIGDIDIEDSSILEIKRSSNELIVSLDSAKITMLGEYDKDEIIIEKPSLRFADVTHESFAGESSSAELPLDFIQVVNYAYGKIVLSGHLQNKPWYEWEIVYAGLSILWGGNVAYTT